MFGFSDCVVGYTYLVMPADCLSMSCYICCTEVCCFNMSGCAVCRGWRSMGSDWGTVDWVVLPLFLESQLPSLIWLYFVISTPASWGASVSLSSFTPRLLLFLPLPVLLACTLGLVCRILSCICDSILENISSFSQYDMCHTWGGVLKIMLIVWHPWSQASPGLCGTFQVNWWVEALLLCKILRLLIAPVPLS